MTTVSEKTATFVRSLTSWRGDARLYRLSHPIAYSPWSEDETATFDYVIASKVAGPYATETYLFGADAEGNVLEWGELDGSQRGVVSHETVLADAGYTVTA